MRPSSMKGPYWFIKATKPSRARGRNGKSTFAPSSGGIGIRLKTKSSALVKATMITSMYR